MNIKELKKDVIKYLSPYKNILLAFSGGVDSTVLLDILYRIKKENLLNINVRAVHINHGLNYQSSDWVIHCIKECKKRNIQLTYINIKFNIYKNIEESTRKARYQAFKAVLNKNEILVTAQHADEQAETFLLALKRGSGPSGLSSMSTKSPFYNSILIRPLLKFTKDIITLYANSKKLKWIEDPSNQDLRFDRNFLRLNILPILKKRWPKFSHIVLRSAKLCANQEALLDELLSKFLKENIYKDGSLKIESLLKMNKIKSLAILRRWLQYHNNIMPSYNQINSIWLNVIKSKKDSIAFIKIKDKQIRKFRNRIYIIDDIKDQKNDNTILWPKNINYILLPQNNGILTKYPFLNIKKHEIVRIRKPKKNEKIYIKFGINNELVYLPNKNYGKKIKKILREMNIPSWERKKIPLLFYNDKLISAIKHFITKEGIVKNKKKMLSITWIKI